MRSKQVKPKKFKKSYRTYDSNAMSDAFIAVKEENMSVCKAAKLFGIPEQTLRDRVKGNISVDCVASGTAPILSNYEEAKIVKHIKIVANLGYGYTRMEVCDIATDYAVRLGKRQQDKPLTLNWFRRFIKRWPELRVLKPRSLEEQRAKCTSAVVVDSYFEGLHKTLKKYNLLDKPQLIFNVDEKGITQNHSPPHVVSSVNFHPNSVTSGKSQTTTILGCGSAAGQAIPPFFVFAGKRLIPDLLNGATPGVNAQMSDSGWSNTDIFRTFLKEHFIKYIPNRVPGQHVLLMLDGHKSHVAVDIIEWAKSKNIVIFVLPAHTSHVLQPLDVACFGPFQRMYNTECHKLIRKHSTGITRYDICGVACKVYAKALSAENLHAAFRKTGIYPYNRDAVSSDCLKPSEVYDNVNNNTTPVAVEKNNVVSIEKTCVTENQQTDSIENQLDLVEEPVDNEKSNESVKSPSNCLNSRIDKLINLKSNAPLKKPRNTLGKIVSGKAVTDSNITNQIIEHKSSNSGKKVSKPKSLKRKSTEPVNKKSKKGKSSVNKKSKVLKLSLKGNKTCSQIAGPSKICVDSSSDYIESDSEYESESQIDPEDKCCVCGLFYPKEVKQSVSLIITKWVQCDNADCKHWVHIQFCTNISTAVRSDDKFYCKHCENENSQNTEE